MTLMIVVGSFWGWIHPQQTTLESLHLKRCSRLIHHSGSSQTFLSGGTLGGSQLLMIGLES